MKEAAKYIDFSGNEELWKEVSNVKGLGQCMFEDGVKVGEERGIQALILDNLEEEIPRARILVKLQKRFELDEEEARAYYEKYAIEN